MSNELLKPLDIKCTDADCRNELHCFKETQKMKVANQAGQCRYCGIDLIDWARLHRRDLADVEYTFAALKNEMIRHHFWHIPIDEKAVNYARRKGRINLRETTENIIRSKVGGANPFHDGFQTPRKLNPVYYAQHATACCCRTCIQYWHGVEKGRELSKNELTYFSDLAMLYINERIPTLNDEGVKVPSIRQLRNMSRN